jgi:hypothetical protein
MGAHPLASWSFALENVAITAGYAFVAAVVAPLFMRIFGVKYWWTKVGGIGFFFLCGLTHAVMALDALFMSDAMPCPMATRWYEHAIHAPQAVCVWLFVIGLYVELTEIDWSARKPETTEPEALP